LESARFNDIYNGSRPADYVTTSSNLDGMEQVIRRAATAKKWA